MKNEEGPPVGFFICTSARPFNRSQRSSSGERNCWPATRHSNVEHSSKGKHSSNQSPTSPNLQGIKSRRGHYCLNRTQVTTVHRGEEEGREREKKHKSQNFDKHAFHCVLNVCLTRFDDPIFLVHAASFTMRFLHVGSLSKTLILSKSIR